MKRSAQHAHRRGHAGFTLVEIMVAMIVVVILVGLASQSLGTSRKVSRIKRAEVQLEILASAVRQLAWDTGCWPNKLPRIGSGAGLNDEVWDLTTAGAGLLATDGSYKNWEGPYLPAVPADPWGNAYFFDPDFTIDGVMMIVVGSMGPNGTGANRYDEDNLFLVLQGQSL